jgi:RimJ/RimL family protein N-acetyltransferase
VAELVQPSLDQIVEFCGREPVERVFLEDVARRGVGRFVATADGGSLRALCHVGVNVVPAGDGCCVFAGEAAGSGTRMVIGAEAAVAELWAALEPRMPPPREDRRGQPVYAIEEPPAPGLTGLRPAVPADLDRLVPACAAAHEEELGVDPLLRDRDAFRWRTRVQIDERRSWLWLEDDVILFKAEASAWTPAAVQLQQVWVDPEARGRGYATRALQDLCRLLLRRVPVVCLFVRPENIAAIRLYERVGMRRALYYRSLLF